jgi:hypothetical protein
MTLLYWCVFGFFALIGVVLFVAGREVVRLSEREEER